MTTSNASSPKRVRVPKSSAETRCGTVSRAICVSVLSGGTTEAFSSGHRDTRPGLSATPTYLVSHLF